MSIAEQIEELTKKWPWGQGWPRGLVRLEEGLIAKETVHLPCRVGLQGVDPGGAVLGMPGLMAHESEFREEDRWLLECDLGVGKPINKFANGNFGTWVRDLNMVLNYQCHGLLFRGAQSSGIENCRVNLSSDGAAPEARLNAAGQLDRLYEKLNGGFQYGIYSSIGGRNQRIQDVDVVGFYKLLPDPFRQCGIKFNGVLGVSGQNNNWHKLRYGLVLDSTRAVSMVNQWFERTDIPFAIYDGSENVSIHGSMVRESTDILVDLSGKEFGRGGAHGDIHLTGTVQAADGKVCYYVDRAGRKKRATSLFANARSERGAYFEIKE